MRVSQRGNIWLLGALAGILFLIGAELYANRPRESPDLKEMKQREAFLRTWKPALPIGSEAPGFSLKDGSYFPEPGYGLRPSGKPPYSSASIINAAGSLT